MAPGTNEFRRLMADYPTGVTVVTATGSRGPAGMTATAVCPLSLEPLLMLVCVSRSARTLVAIETAGRFAVNVLAAGQEDVARRFATKDAEEEKWRGIAWEAAHGGPRILGCASYLGCELREKLDGGDHVICTGEVAELAEGGGKPLLWHRGEAKDLL